MVERSEEPAPPDVNLERHGNPLPLYVFVAPPS